MVCRVVVGGRWREGDGTGLIDRDPGHLVAVEMGIIVGRVADDPVPVLIERCDALTTTIMDKVVERFEVMPPSYEAAADGNRRRRQPQITAVDLKTVENHVVTHEVDDVIDILARGFQLGPLKAGGTVDDVAVRRVRVAAGAEGDGGSNRVSPRGDVDAIAGAQ